MRTKKLIEKLEDLATFFTLASNDANKEAIKKAKKGATGDALVYEGAASAYNTAFVKVDKLINEAKR